MNNAHAGYQHRLTVEAAGREFHLSRRGDLEQLWDEMDELDELDGDERLPYWVEPWPASLALARYIAAHPGLVAGRRCLDLGCGLGLAGLAALSLGARVLAVDYEAEALRYVRLNAQDNGLPEPMLAVMDWREGCLTPGSVDVVLAADVLYEKRFTAPVLSLLKTVLPPGGLALLADPERPFVENFLEEARVRGFAWRLELQEKTPTPSQPQVLCGVRVYALRRA